MSGSHSLHNPSVFVVPASSLSGNLPVWPVSLCVVITITYRLIRFLVLGSFTVHLAAPVCPAFVCETPADGLRSCSS